MLINSRFPRGSSKYCCCSSQSPSSGRMVTHPPASGTLGHWPHTTDTLSSTHGMTLSLRKQLLPRIYMPLSGAVPSQWKADGEHQGLALLTHWNNHERPSQPQSTLCGRMQPQCQLHGDKHGSQEDVPRRTFTVESAIGQGPRCCALKSIPRLHPATGCWQSVTEPQEHKDSIPLPTDFPEGNLDASTQLPPTPVMFGINVHQHVSLFYTVQVHTMCNTQFSDDKISVLFGVSLTWPLILTDGSWWFLLNPASDQLTGVRDDWGQFQQDISWHFE